MTIDDFGDLPYPIAEPMRLLESGPVHRLDEVEGLSADELPLHAKGVYTIWRGEELLFVGMAGVGLRPPAVDRFAERDRASQPWGLRVRLAAHAAGWRARDQFCVDVGDRIVLPSLSPDDLTAIAAGRDSLDRRIRDVIAEQMTCRIAQLSSTNTARELDRRLRQGALAAGPPLFNALPGEAPEDPGSPEPSEDDEVDAPLAGPEGGSAPADDGETGSMEAAPADGGETGSMEA